MIYSVIIFVILSNLFHVESDKDYCSPGLCPAGVTHVACNNDEKFGEHCSIDAKLLKMDRTIVEKILKKHNELRNQVAHGGFNGFSPAARMATISWDDELAYLASITVRSCSTKHDKCHNTRQFPTSGQNSVYKAYTGEIPQTSEIINSQINMWFDQSIDMTMESIISFAKPQPGKPTANFALLIQEGANKIGCAIVVQNRNDWYQQFLTCNYAAINILGRPVYSSAHKAASACHTGRNTEFPYLCSTLENYDDEYINSDSASSGSIGTIAKDEDLTSNHSENGNDNENDKNSIQNETQNQGDDENQNKDNDRSSGSNVPKSFENLLNHLARNINHIKKLNISINTHAQEQSKSDRVRFSTKVKDKNSRKEKRSD